MRTEPGTSSTNRVIHMYYRCPKRNAHISGINLQKILIDKLNSYAWIFNQGLWKNLIGLPKRELLDKMNPRVLYSKKNRTAAATLPQFPLMIFSLITPPSYLP